MGQGASNDRSLPWTSLRATNGERLSNIRPVVTDEYLEVREGTHVFLNAGEPLTAIVLAYKTSCFDSSDMGVSSEHQQRRGDCNP